MTKVHMWKRMSMLGLIQVQCGRKVKSTQFTSNAVDVTCAACLNKMSEGARK
jgi:hypothetical protein